MRIDELRKNPNKNPKNSIVDILHQYKDDPNTYVSFTSLNKLGINPHSTYDTPLGIYSYPVQALWKKYISYFLNQIADGLSMEHVIPFGGDAPYAVIFRVNHSGMLDNHSEINLMEYRDKLVEVLDVNFTRPDGWYKIIEKLYNESTTKAYNKTPLGKLWYLTYFASRRVEYDMKKKASRVWNFIMRKLGITGVVDQEGIIHFHEPVQAVFFSMENIKVISVVDNKTYVDSGFGDINKNVDDFLTARFCGDPGSSRSEKIETFKKKFTEFVYETTKTPMSPAMYTGRMKNMVSAHYNYKRQYISIAVDNWFKKYKEYAMEILVHFTQAYDDHILNQLGVKPSS